MTVKQLIILADSVTYGRFCPDNYFIWIHTFYMRSFVSFLLPPRTCSECDTICFKCTSSNACANYVFSSESKSNFQASASTSSQFPSPNHFSFSTHFPAPSHLQPLNRFPFSSRPLFWSNFLKNFLASKIQTRLGILSLLLRCYIHFLDLAWSEIRSGSELSIASFGT